ncbi:MAG: SDR family NAD(P)-dependent oxidoreductase [Kiritimatiellae bacterium]|nr:SDR family NAD(P)-dependent oxidoreductase [Kiritimatiellia bacterium]
MGARAYVVTGASSGIGEAVARRILSRGDAALLVARREDRLAALASAFPAARILACDLSAEGAADRVAAAVSALGPLAGFVHCAGFAAPAPIGMVEESAARALFAVHALFPLMFLGWLARRRNHADGASAVLVSSRSAREADVGNAAYASAKGAVEGLFATARAELAPRGVRVALYAPSEVDTDMARETWMRTASPERIAEIMARHPGGLPSADDAAAEIVAILDGEEKS